MVKQLPRPRRPRQVRRPRKDGGYNIVVLAVMFTVMNIMIAKALPLWSSQIQRDKEEELIFRGLQYAEAIRVFRIRHQRYPVRLQELIEVNPRSIRQLWNNPLSEEALGKPPAGIGWGLIFQGRPVTPPQQQQAGGSGSLFAREDRVEVGPIIGVYSKAGDEAFKMFCGSDSIPGWRFTEQHFQQGAPQPRGRNLNPNVNQRRRQLQRQRQQRQPQQQRQQPGQPPGQVVPINAALVGRPWPPGVTPQNNLGNAGCTANQLQGAPNQPPRGQQRQ